MPQRCCINYNAYNGNVCSHLLNNFSFHPIKEVIVVAAIRNGGKTIRIGGKDH